VCSHRALDVARLAVRVAHEPSDAATPRPLQHPGYFRCVCHSLPLSLPFFHIRQSVHEFDHALHVTAGWIGGEPVGPLLSRKIPETWASDFKQVGLKPWPRPDGVVAFFFPRTLWDHTGACGTLSLSSVSCRDLRQACTDEKGPSASDGCRGLKDNRGKGDSVRCPTSPTPEGPWRFRSRARAETC
jgi:hypothetical protein